MYSIDYLEPISDLIEEKILNERLKYSSVYDVIEEYISFSSKNNIIVGGSMAVNLLLEKERSLTDFSYELYAENAFIHANNLTNLIDEKCGYIVYLKSSIANVRYQIIVDTRILITFINLKEGSAEIISPVKCKSFDKKRDMLVVSPEIQLIDIYRTLYSPNQFEFWETSLYDETKLFKHLKKRISKIEKVGADESVQPTQEERRTVELQLIKQFVVNNKNIVLLGEHAMKILNDIETNTLIISLISQNDVEEDFIEIEKIIKSSLKRNIPVVKLTRELYIMRDFRIRRTTIKIGGVDEGQKDVAYIYNSAQYDLIPFNKVLKMHTEDFIQIGNPFVLLRFLLIDFWMIRWISFTSNIDKSYAQKRLDSILDKILILRSSLESKHLGKFKKNKEIDIDPKLFDTISNMNLFQSSSNNYLGYFVDENISQKMIIKDLPKKFYDYYPSDYKKKYGSYRSINHL